MTEAASEHKHRGVILDFESLAPDSLDCNALLSLPSVDWDVYPHTQPDQVLQRVGGADIVLTNKVILDQHLLSEMPKLKYIGVLATGTNNVDLAACQQLGIKVKNVEAYGTASVAQHTLMLMLTLATSAQRYQSAVAKGEWSKAPQFCLLNHPVVELNGKHLVIVGYGELGQAVAKLADAFGMRVSVAIRPGNKGVSTQPMFELNGKSYQRKSLEELLPQADFVSLHCVLSAETDKLINQQCLYSMPQSAFLINTARGGLVDEEALLDALRNNQIAGAGLDVLSAEPPPEAHCLLNAALPNLVITPHTAWAAKEARQRLLNIATAHLQDHLESLC